MDIVSTLLVHGIRVGAIKVLRTDYVKVKIEPDFMEKSCFSCLAKYSHQLTMRQSVFMCQLMTRSIEGSKELDTTKFCNAVFVTKTIKPIAERMGFTTNFTAHGGRRRACSEIEAIGGRTLAQEVINHADPSMTKHYTTGGEKELFTMTNMDAVFTI